jgi:hypothetical protein
MRRTFDLLLASTLSAVLAVGLYAVAIGSRVEAAYIPVPSGTIAYFNKTSCPVGWTEFTSARGAYILGRVASGTLNTLVGSALTDQENRATGIHGHTASSSTPTSSTPTSSTPTSSAPSVNDPGHRHNGHVFTTPVTNHSVPAGGFASADNSDVNGATDFVTLSLTGLTVNAPTISTPTISTPTISTPTITVVNSTGTAGTNAPYLQLLVCSKS